MTIKRKPDVHPAPPPKRTKPKQPSCPGVRRVRTPWSRGAACGPAGPPGCPWRGLSACAQRVWAEVTGDGLWTSSLAQARGAAGAAGRPGLPALLPVRTCGTLGCGEPARRLLRAALPPRLPLSLPAAPPGDRMTCPPVWLTQAVNGEAGIGIQLFLTPTLLLEQHPASLGW